MRIVVLVFMWVSDCVVASVRIAVVVVCVGQILCHCVCIICDVVGGCVLRSRPGEPNAGVSTAANHFRPSVLRLCNDFAAAQTPGLGAAAVSPIVSVGDGGDGGVDGAVSGVDGLLFALAGNCGEASDGDIALAISYGAVLVSVVDAPLVSWKGVAVNCLELIQ